MRIEGVDTFSLLGFNDNHLQMIEDSLDVSVVLDHTGARYRQRSREPEHGDNGRKKRFHRRPRVAVKHIGHLVGAHYLRTPGGHCSPSFGIECRGAPIREVLGSENARPPRQCCDRAFPRIPEDRPTGTESDPRWASDCPSKRRDAGSLADVVLPAYSTPSITVSIGMRTRNLPGSYSSIWYASPVATTTALCMGLRGKHPTRAN